MKASKAFFRSAKAVTAIISTRITTDGHDRYPRAIRSARGPACEAPTSRYLNNRLEQDHRRIKGRYRPMRGFKCAKSAAKFCQKYDEFRNFVRPILPYRQQSIPANYRRLYIFCAATAVISILQAV